MIIRITFNDNDYTEDLKEYWNDFWFKNYYYNIKELEDKNDKDSLKKYKDIRIEMDELLEKAVFNEKDMTEDELKRFKEILTESIFAFLNSNFDYVIDYLKANFSIDYVSKVDDVWENDEVLYYFLSSKQMIVL